MSERTERIITERLRTASAWLRAAGYVQADADIGHLLAEVAALGNALLAESVKTPEIRELEIGDAVCAAVCGKLRAIFDTGEHRGTFGGEELESLAQAILAQRAEVAALGERLRVCEAENARLIAAGHEFVAETPDSIYRQVFLAALDEAARAALAGTGAPPDETLEFPTKEGRLSVGKQLSARRSHPLEIGEEP